MIDTIIQYHDRYPQMRLSILKRKYLEYLRMWYEDSNSTMKLKQNIKQKAIAVNDMNYENILDLFLSSGYKYKGCRCNCGGVLITNE